MLPNQQFYHDCTAYHAAEVLDNFELSFLVEHIRDRIGSEFSLFDYELVCSYVWGDDFGGPSSLLEFTLHQREPSWSPLQTLREIPTFADNKAACGNWLCHPIRLHA